MKSFWIGVLSFVLKMVDVDVSLKDDKFTISMSIGGKEVINWEVDLIKEKDHKTKIAGSTMKNSKFKSARVSYD